MGQSNRVGGKETNRPLKNKKSQKNEEASHEYLVNLILLPVVHRFRIRWRSQVEFRITEVPIPVHIMQTFPNHLIFCKETLVGHQKVKLALRERGNFPVN